MKPSTYLILLFILLALHLATASAAAKATTTIGKTCKGISKSNPNIHRRFCVSILTREASAKITRNTRITITDLSHLSIDATVSTAKATSSHIKKLLLVQANAADDDDDYVKRSLQICRKLYSDAISLLRSSKKAIMEGKFDDAKASLSSVVTSPSTCNDGLSEKDVDNPLEKQNKDLFQVAAITLAVVNQF